MTAVLCVMVEAESEKANTRTTGVKRTPPTDSVDALTCHSDDGGVPAGTIPCDLPSPSHDEMFTRSIVSRTKWNPRRSSPKWSSLGSTTVGDPHTLSCASESRPVPTACTSINDGTITRYTVISVSVCILSAISLLPSCVLERRCRRSLR